MVWPVIARVNVVYPYRQDHGGWLFLYRFMAMAEALLPKGLSGGDRRISPHTDLASVSVVAFPKSVCKT